MTTTAWSERVQNLVAGYPERKELEAELYALAAELDSIIDDTRAILGKCPHGVDLDRDFCSEGCRV